MKKILLAALISLTVLTTVPVASAQTNGLVSSTSSAASEAGSLSPAEPQTDNSFSLAAIAIVDGQGVSACNGVTLNEDWVLSASHCFDQSLDLGAYTIFTDARSGVEDVQQVAGTDLALVRLAGDRPSVGCTPLPDSSPPVGQEVEVYTFRGNGRVETLPFIVKSTEHIADNPAAGVGPHPMLSLMPPEDGSLTRGGDSGSGVFLTNFGGEKRIAGIVAGLSSEDDVTLAENLARYSDDIEEVVGPCIVA